MLTMKKQDLGFQLEFIEDGVSVARCVLKPPEIIYFDDSIGYMIESGNIERLSETIYPRGSAEIMYISDVLYRQEGEVEKIVAQAEIPHDKKQPISMMCNHRQYVISVRKRLWGIFKCLDIQENGVTIAKIKMSFFINTATFNVDLSVKEKVFLYILAYFSLNLRLSAR